MRILLDTHIFLWFIAGDAKLDDYSRELIERMALLAKDSGFGDYDVQLV